jgi:hypothetical protein
MWRESLFADDPITRSPDQQITRFPDFPMTRFPDLPLSLDMMKEP